MLVAVAIAICSVASAHEITEPTKPETNLAKEMELLLQKPTFDVKEDIKHMCPLRLIITMRL